MDFESITRNRRRLMSFTNFRFSWLFTKFLPFNEFLPCCVRNVTTFNDFAIFGNSSKAKMCNLIRSSNFAKGWTPKASDDEVVSAKSIFLRFDFEIAVPRAHWGVLPCFCSIVSCESHLFNFEEIRAWGWAYREIPRFLIGLLRGRMPPASVGFAVRKQ